ncbi:CGNR zinc finger domain-containing protein [Streptomyces sp. B3I8]|jgi:predicted RNA-binding Zn ribbon-like protein|uniref:CGNR zinc finger domain-containing protein n=1 Tax=Streptomyces sp. B3I8 TaxID=3042303 RepID=UPI002781A9FA|nr:CGNR zinc finger domain-containing protein [Streptomyces sp. B3I8]MDQ0784698.1 putative RNA-binding Zn ribbon-like protein [Streptomyces sp. B3I8]
MTWAATDRYDIEPAPDGLALVQDLLNTLSADKPRKADLLLDREDAQAWLDTVWRDRNPMRDQSPIQLDSDDVQRLHTFRDGLRDWLTKAGEKPAGEHSPLPQVPFDAALRLDPDGTVQVEPAGSGWQVVVSLVLIEMLHAQRAGTWRRLKVCRSERCRVTFFDRSRNNSGVWHDVRKCGHPANLRAYRARRRTPEQPGLRH